MKYMLEKRNKKFLIITILLFFICFFVVNDSEFIKKENISIIILECALLLLFCKKRKIWAFWCCFLLFLFYITHTELPLIYKQILSTILFLVGGGILLYLYNKTGKEIYVTPACFCMIFGLFGFIVLLPFFDTENICILLLICLALVWYTSHNTKKNKMIESFIKSLLVFIIALCFLQK